MKHFISILLFFPVIFTVFSVTQQETVYGDGVFYYSWLRSIVLDRDIDFTNEYQRFRVNQLPTKVGLIGNQFAVGPAFFWSPAFLLVHQLLQGDGYGFIYQYAVGFINVLYGLLGLLLFFRIVSKFIPDKEAICLTVALGIGTHLFFYIALDTVTSHALSFLFGVVLLTLLTEVTPRWWLLGSVAGLLGLMRIQDAAFIVLPILLLLIRRAWHSPGTIFQLTTGFLLTVSFQFFSWFLLYGDIRIPYIERGYGFNFLNPQILQVLFSLNNGLFLWTPLAAIACSGTLYALYRIIQNKKSVFPAYLYLAALGFFTWQTYLVGSWSIWWQGASFSGRMFLSILPFLFLGLADIWKRWPNILPRLLLFFSCLNIIFLSFFLAVFQK